MKVYLAAPFGDRPKMERVADLLKTKGFEIVSRWVYGGETGMTRQQIAVLDLADVEIADVVVSFTFPRGTPFTGGGRHVEFGYALARGKQLVLIGERENVFHHFPNVSAFPSVDAWLDSVVT
jgi:nucleoside 2-deoxyribosyltransferase